MLSMVGPCIPNVAVVTGIKGEGPRERTARNWKPEGEGQAQDIGRHVKGLQTCKKQTCKKVGFLPCNLLRQGVCDARLHYCPMLTIHTSKTPRVNFRLGSPRRKGRAGAGRGGAHSHGP